MLTIEDPETQTLAHEIARLTGKTVSAVVAEALREKLERECGPGTGREGAAARLMEMGRRIASLPVLDPRTPDEILHYDDSGVPHS